VPVLLMSQGDTQAKDLLRRVIEARYGYQPPVIETLRITMRGRVPTKIGPLSLNAQMEITAYFRFSSTVRFDVTVRFLGIPLQRISVGYDGTTVYRKQGDTVTMLEGESSPYRSFLWAAAGFFLTPLGEHFVELSSTGEHSFDAKNVQNGDVASLQLHSDNRLDKVQVSSPSAANDQPQIFTLGLNRDRVLINDLALPTQVTASWKGITYTLAPVSAEVNPPLQDALFTLQQ